MTEQHDAVHPVIPVTSRTLPTGQARSYVRFAALGDSATHGVGDLVGAGWRGWARLLAEAVAEHHDQSFLNLAQAGATASDVRSGQLEDAVTHRPHLASLVVGLNDTMRSSWDPARVREDLLHCAEELTEAGARLLTVRFHDHSRVFRLPRVLARPMQQRIATLNDVYDEIAATYGGIHLDLSACATAYQREFWSVDRLHPSELGHRFLANEFGRLLNEAGLAFEATGLAATSPKPGRLHDLRWLVTEGAPWVGRRARDLARAKFA
jgi:lysophospholipase L1-like esterase